MSYLSLSNVTKIYGETTVLHGVTLGVEAGELVSLLGPSGCGKTTTLRIVAGFIEPNGGSVELAGKSLNGVAAYRRNIGVVFQSYALFPHMTAGQNVGFGLKMRGISREDRERRSREALALVGLGDFGDRFPSELSGGQQQRVALARALVIEPDILLLDEPLSNLDAGLRAGMRDEIARLRTRLGITTLFVTHDQSEALAMSDRVVVMDDGRIVEVAPPEQLTERPGSTFTARFLGQRTVLPGEVVARDGKPVFIAKTGAEKEPEIAISAEDAAAAPTHAVLRASRLAVAKANARAGASPINIAAQVEDAVFLGDQRQITLKVGDQRITVLNGADTPAPEPGQSVRLRAGANAVSFLHEPQT